MNSVHHNAVEAFLGNCQLLDNSDIFLRCFRAIDYLLLFIVLYILTSSGYNKIYDDSRLGRNYLNQTNILNNERNS